MAIELETRPKEIISSIEQGAENKEYEKMTAGEIENSVVNTLSDAAFIQDPLAYKQNRTVSLRPYDAQARERVIEDIAWHKIDGRHYNALLHDKPNALHYESNPEVPENLIDAVYDNRYGDQMIQIIGLINGHEEKSYEPSFSDVVDILREKCHNPSVYQRVMRDMLLRFHYGSRREMGDAAEMLGALLYREQWRWWEEIRRLDTEGQFLGLGIAQDTYEAREKRMSDEDKEKIQYPLGRQYQEEAHREQSLFQIRKRIKEESETFEVDADHNKPTAKLPSLVNSGHEVKERELVKS